MVWKAKELWIIPSESDEAFRRNQLMHKGHEPQAIDAIISDEVMQGILVKHMTQDKGNHKAFDKLNEQNKNKVNKEIDYTSHNRSVECIKELKKRFPNA
jgi:5-methylcytosine-specific restriction endonuclease McrBC GTP-binding regulatory subunit McrB